MPHFEHKFQSEAILLMWPMPFIEWQIFAKRFSMYRQGVLVPSLHKYRQGVLVGGLVHWVCESH